MKNPEVRISLLPSEKRQKCTHCATCHRDSIIVDEPIADSILKQENIVLLKIIVSKRFILGSQSAIALSMLESKSLLFVRYLKRKLDFTKAVSGIGGFFTTGYYKTKVIDIGNLCKW